MRVSDQAVHHLGVARVHQCEHALHEIWIGRIELGHSGFDAVLATGNHRSLTQAEDRLCFGIVAQPRQVRLQKLERLVRQQHI